MPSSKQSDRADVAASTVGDPFPQHPDLAGLGDGLDRLDRRPTDQTRALLGDPSTADMGVGLVMFGCQTGQQVSFWAEENRVMSPISATKTAPRVGPMPGIFCTAVYPGSWAIRPRMMPANTMISKSTSSSNRRSDAIRAAYGARQLELVQQLRAP